MVNVGENTFQIQRYMPFCEAMNQIARRQFQQPRRTVKICDYERKAWVK